MQIFSDYQKITIVNIFMYFTLGLSVCFHIEIMLYIWSCNIHFPHVIKYFIKIKKEKKDILKINLGGSLVM